MTQDMPQNNRPVIIVEDDKPLRNSVVKYLTLDGYQVTGVGSAQEFYQQIFAKSYAVAIIDVGLPDQSGLILAEYVRKNTDIRIIMFTARASIDDQLAGHLAGADIYLVKPVDLRQLSVSIATLLSRMPTSAHFITEKPPEPPLPEAWRLIPMQWTLQSPLGVCIKLTTKELDFMTMLVSPQKAVIARLELLKNLGYFNNESGNHSLQSLVNRLRYKIQSCCSLSPIQTSHSVGYIFIDEITIE
ncbi:MAG: response regulator transcription factor [Chlorobiaceae bacterium]